MDTQIEQIRSRFQFVVILYLLLPTLLSSLGKVANMNDMDSTILKYSLPIAFLVADYLMIELSKDSMANWLRKVLNIIIPIQIGLFIPVLAIFGSLQDKANSFSTILYYVYGISIIGISLIPMITLILLVAGAFSNFNKKHGGDIVRT